MAHPLLYDIRRVFFSKTVLIAMALLIVISFFLVYSFSATTVTQQTSPNNEILSWYDNSGTYHFVVFETNQFGNGVSGISFQANLTVSGYNPQNKSAIINPQSYPVYQGPSVTTNSSGEAQFTINVPAANISQVNSLYSLYTKISQPNGFFQSSGIGQPTPYSPYTNLSNGSSVYLPVGPGQVVSIPTSPLTTVSDSSNSLKQDVMVTWAGNNGSLPSSYPLYYSFQNGTCHASQFQACGFQGFSQGILPSSLSESNMTFWTKMTSYQQVFNSPKLEANLGNNSQITVALFSPSNSTAPISYASFPVNELYPPAQTVSLTQADQFVTSFLTSIYSFFVPLIAIIGSYNAYGKDRVSGVLESVLVQPVSRRGLALSRFIATFTGMAIAIGISMAVVDGLVYYYAKAFLSSSILLSSMGAFFVELAAFIGIMMLLSRVIKSSGLLIGIGIGLFLIFDFLWSVIILLLLAATRTGFGSNAYISYTIAAEFANPAQFISLVITYLTSSNNSVGISLSPSQYGVTIPSLVVTGILWIALPLAGFLYLAVKRD